MQPSFEVQEGGREFVGQWCNPSYVEIKINLLNLSYLFLVLCPASFPSIDRWNTLRSAKGIAANFALFPKLLSKDIPSRIRLVSA